MRAMGFVPWSGMNVACGVVGVDWKVFWLTTAAGSASWSYVTASVGNILSRLAVPSSAVAASVVGDGDVGEVVNGESLTSLLRDPILIAKLVFLSLITLLPVVLKRRTPRSVLAAIPLEPVSISTDCTPHIVHPAIQTTRLQTDFSPSGSLSPPMSPLSQSLTKFTPVPAVFDLLSFGRTAGRQGGKVLAGGFRGVKKFVGS
jgi:hypothetical protein